MLLWKQPHVLPFFFYKSTTSCQIDSNKVSQSYFESSLCICVKSETINDTASVQQPHKQIAFLGHHILG